MTDKHEWRWAPDEDGWDTDDGAVGIGLFSRAIQVWSAMQDHPTTVADAVAVFHVPPSAIIEAVEYHPWIFLSGPDDDFSKMVIDHDGE